MVPTMREPVMPNGWPIEIEPPLTLSFSGSMPEAVAAVDDLRGERLVQLPHVDVVDLQAVTLQQLGHREHRADAHLVRLAAGDGEAAEDELRPDAEGLGAIHRHHQRRAGAVGELRRVAGGDGALAGVLSKCGGSLSNPSSVVSARLHSSFST